MKRIIAFIFVGVALFGLLLGNSNNFDYDGLIAVTLITSDRVEQEDITTIKSGEDYYITTDAQTARTLAKQLEVKGYNLHFDKTCDVEKLKNQFMDFCLPETIVEGVSVYEGYTKTYQDFRYVNGKKINVQMAVLEEEILIGFPLILTGF